MRWFGFGNGSRDDPVRIVQRAPSEPADMNLHSMIDGLDAIVGEQLWQLGTPFRVLLRVRDPHLAEQIGCTLLTASQASAILLYPDR